MKRSQTVRQGGPGPDAGEAADGAAPDDPDGQAVASTLIARAHGMAAPAALGVGSDPAAPAGLDGDPDGLAGIAVPDPGRPRPRAVRRARTGVPPPSGETRALLLQVHERLCAQFGCPIGYFHDHDPLSELVAALLSHRTKNRDSAQAFRQLREALPTWAAVRDAPPDAVQAAIAPATWPEQKAPRIQAVLRELSARLAGTPGQALGDDALDFLGTMSVRAARDWLESIGGIGPKTSAAVLAFSRLRLAALPVDSHHHRVAVRLGLLPASVDVGPAHAWLEAQLPADWSAQQVYDNHEVLMLHGQRVCHWRAPQCGRCVLRDLCPTGQARLGAARRPEPPESPEPPA